MGLFKRNRATDVRRAGRKVSAEGTTIFALKANTSGGGLFSAFQGGVVITSTGPSKDLEARIRKEARDPKAEVVVVEPSDWDPPAIPSLTQTDIAEAYPHVVRGASSVLSRAFGIGPLKPSQMTDHGMGAMPSPMGHVLFLFAIPGRFEWAGDAASD